MERTKNAAIHQMAGTIPDADTGSGEWSNAAAQQRNYLIRTEASARERHSAGGFYRSDGIPGHNRARRRKFTARVKRISGGSR